MYTLQVEEMSCGHCVAAVTKALQALDADARVHVDLASRRVEVDTRAPVDAVKEAIEEAGYPVAGAAER
ncbi:MAG TPA: cation transporter [Burkholderiaceae bacterium]